MHIWESRIRLSESLPLVPRQVQTTARSTCLTYATFISYKAHTHVYNNTSRFLLNSEPTSSESPEIYKLLPYSVISQHIYILPFVPTTTFLATIIIAFQNSTRNELQEEKRVT